MCLCIYFLCIKTKKSIFLFLQYADGFVGVKRICYYYLTWGIGGPSTSNAFFFFEKVYVLTCLKNCLIYCTVALKLDNSKKF